LSDRSRRDVSHAADVQILVDVVDHLRLRRVALLGQSHGAPMAATYAADHPRAVSHLVLDGMTRFRGEVDARWTALRALLLADWQVGSLAMASVMLAGASSEEIAAFARLWRCCVSAEMAVALNDVAILHDLSDVFARLRVPTLVVSRRDDPLLAPEESRRVAMQISGAELVILDGSAHLTHAGDVDALVEVVRGFLRGGRRPATDERARSTRSG